VPASDYRTSGVVRWQRLHGVHAREVRDVGRGLGLARWHFAKVRHNFASVRCTMTRSALNPEERAKVVCVTIRPDQVEKAKKFQQHRMLSGLLQMALDNVEEI